MNTDDGTDNREGGREGGSGNNGDKIFPSTLTPPSQDAKTLFLGGLNPTVTR